MRRGLDSFIATPSELSFVDWILSQADPRNTGIITVEAAVKFFSGSNLPLSTLTEIWAFADYEEKGWLNRRGLAIATRLIGWAQIGESVRESLLAKAGPIPAIQGMEPESSSSLPPPLAMSSALCFFTPSSSELAFTDQIFRRLDPSNAGIIMGDAAVKLFSGSNLPDLIIGEIWSFADFDGNGWLTRNGVAIAVRLMGWAQKGNPITEALLQKAGPLPSIQGLFLAPDMPPLSIPRRTSSSEVTSTLPPLSPEARAKYLQIFLSCGPTNGVLSGMKAREVYSRSKLPPRTLLKIWKLADAQSRDSLDSTDFIIGLFLVHLCMKSQLDTIPTRIPPEIYEQASGGKGKGKSVNTSHVQNSFINNSGPSTSKPAERPSPSIPTPQPTVSGQPRQSQPTVPAASTPSPFSPVQSSGINSTGWDVTPEEKVVADRFFDELDTQRRGYIEGDVTVPFMLQSHLPNSTLRKIWDLVDIRCEGKLTRESFAVALHLIRRKLGGEDIPNTLPPGLIPLNMRQPATPIIAQQASWPPDEPPPPYSA
ncbi:hypothetical protein BOTBODRAFT_176409 [Botryobasidium botryosum FD-172 SS1]|uniref:EH domain-containing protein n=1 Tax=Botryobasidium botryosum (strain FD-172 SS1) TaxID=930990 RepID=A0A067MA87_BOTB1|nr:hypothetical protein BOTBODRAFT_176409 [Botryobasidium botryosum FD-172 SS1]